MGADLLRPRLATLTATRQPLGKPPWTLERAPGCPKSRKVGTHADAPIRDGWEFC
jgi:hypothetical protein